MPRSPAKKIAPASAAGSLSREKIVETALALISENGLDGFSLRDVARALGVYPTAIYWYVKSKNALLGEVCAAMLATVLPARGSGSWQDWIRLLCRRYRKAMKQHPNLAQLVGARLLSNSSLDVDLIERVLQVLEEAGCPPERIVELYNTVIAAMCGFVTLEFAPLPSEGAEAWSDELAQRVHGISALRHPTLARHLPALANNSFILRWQSGHQRPLERSFETYLDVVVAGLERELAAC